MTTLDAADEGAGPIACPHCADDHPASWSHCPNTGQPMHSGPALHGRLVAQRYRVLGLLGEGGMGAVYEAEHVQLGRRVALKRLHPELVSDENAVRRFQREARAAGTTGHAHIVDVLDLGFAEDGAPYLAMELLVGETLAARLRRAGRIEPRRAVRIAGEILSALEAVHGRGVIHRDLKPDNVFLCRREGRRDFVKVLDFGISKMQSPDRVTEALTRTGVMMGTPHYMSAEQARGLKDLDHRVDLYALGVMLYECLAGVLPVAGSNYHALLQSILNGSPEPLSVHVPTLPEGLCAVVHKAMAREREDRYPDAHAMLDALRPFGAVALHAPGTSRPPPPRGDAPTARMDSDALADRLAEARASRRPISGERARPSATPRSDSMPSVQPQATEPFAFVAQSDDYEPGPYTPIRRAAPKVAETGPTWSSSDAEATVKASLLLAVEAAVDDAHGSGTGRRIIEADPELADRWPPGLLPIARLPFDTLERFLATVAERFGASLAAFHGYGVRAGESERLGTHRRLLEHATERTSMRRLGAFYASYMSAGRLYASPGDDGVWTLKLEGADVSPELVALLAGIVQRVLGAADLPGEVAARVIEDRAATIELTIG